MDRVVLALRALREDQFMQMDLKDPVVLQALDHWTGRKRLDRAVAEKRFNDNYQVQQVLHKLARLQAACREAGIGLPLKALKAGSVDPFYGVDKTAKQPRREASQQLPDQHQPQPDQPDQQQHPQPDQQQPPQPGQQPMEAAADALPFRQWLELTPRNIALWWTAQMALIAMALPAVAKAL